MTHDVEAQLTLSGVDIPAPAHAQEQKRNPLLDWDTEPNQRRYTLIMDAAAADGSAKMTFRLPKWLKKDFIKLAAEDEVSTSMILREMIEARVRAKKIQDTQLTKVRGSSV